MKKIKKFAAGLAALSISLTLAGCSGYKYMGPSSTPGKSVTSSKFDEVYNLMKNDWYYGPEIDNLEEQLIDKALTGMTSFEEDIHTQYLQLDRSQTYNQQLAGSNKGIGIGCYQTMGGPLSVKSIYIDSPSDKAGLQAGDQILKIDDIDTTTKPIEELIDYIKNSDHPLILEVNRKGEILNVELTAESYDSTVAFDKEDDLGLIILSSFSQDSGKDCVEAMKRLEAAGVKNLIIDLRGNSGGYLHAMTTIASALLPEDSVVFKERMRDGTEIESTVEKSDYKANFDHVYILQNGNSASASEVLIGALKDNLGDKVTTLGSQTYGKGTAQYNRIFDDGTTFKYTIAEWLTPNGSTVNKVGLAPDIEVPLDEYMTVQYQDMQEGDEPIRPDTVHPNAAALQVYLRYLGYPAERSDAYFSPASAEALKLFQQEHGMEPTGEADWSTFNAVVDAMGDKINTEGYDTDMVYQKAVELIRNPQQ